MPRRRIAAKEYFLWRGWKFRLSQATSRNVEWQFKLGKLRIRLLYRDTQDPEVPPEYTAIMQVIGVTSGNGVAETAAEALAHAENDLKLQLVQGARIWEEIARRGVLERAGELMPHEHHDDALEPD